MLIHENCETRFELEGRYELTPMKYLLYDAPIGRIIEINGFRYVITALPVDSFDSNNNRLIRTYSVSEAI